MKRFAVIFSAAAAIGFAMFFMKPASEGVMKLPPVERVETATSAPEQAPALNAPPVASSASMATATSPSVSSGSSSPGAFTKVTLEDKTVPPPERPEDDERIRHIKARMVLMGGIENDVMIKYMDRQQRMFASCARGVTNSTGTLFVRFLIDGKGNVTKAAVVREFGSFENETVEKCVLARVMSTVFPEPVGGGAVEVDYPIDFK